MHRHLPDWEFHLMHGWALAAFVIIAVWVLITIKGNKNKP